MTTMADGLEAQDSSKSAFMEFGQQSHSQQSSPSMASGHYPLHCLHSGSHAHHQHDNTPYSGTNPYNRSLPYPYVSHPHHSPYLPSYHNNTGGQTRLDGAGKRPHFHQPNGKRTASRPSPALPFTFVSYRRPTVVIKPFASCQCAGVTCGQSRIGNDPACYLPCLLLPSGLVLPLVPTKPVLMPGVCSSRPCNPHQLLVEIRQPARLECCN